MMQAPEPEYRIIKGVADDAELERYRECFSNNGTEKKLNHLSWQHRENTAGKNSIFYAMHGESVAAIYTAMPVLFKLSEKIVPALQSIDTITDVQHRGKGLFPKLARKLFDDSSKEGFELVYGFPNENSAPGFFKKLNWISFGEVPFLIKPLRLSYFLKKLLKIKVSAAGDEYHSVKEVGEKKIDTALIRPLSNFGADYEILWGKVSGTMEVCINRDAAYMNWRFVNKPDAIYSRYGCYENGILTGAVVFTITNKHGGRIGYLMELLYDPAYPKAGEILLTFAKRIFKKERTDVVLCWSLPHAFNNAVYRKAGYLKLPPSLRPQKLFFGVLPLASNKQGPMETVESWYLSYADSDTT